MRFIHFFPRRRDQPLHAVIRSTEEQTAKKVDHQMERCGPPCRGLAIARERGRYVVFFLPCCASYYCQYDVQEKYKRARYDREEDAAPPAGETRER
jgi:hypothetical protein